jgi:hypothetical protein
MEVDIKRDQEIAYCYGCHHYFSIHENPDRKREEILLPLGANMLRYREDRSELELSIKWRNNLELSKVLKKEYHAQAPSLFFALGFLFNTTTIRATRKFLEIKTTPLDILPYTYYTTQWIKQFYVSIFRLGPYNNYSNGPGLFIEFKNGREKLLLWDLKEETLLFIEQELERVMGIEDTH